jgi:DNA-binding NtrC family response regulator
MDNRKIMIVDDEPSILFTLKSLLSQYQVHCYSDSVKAIESLTQGDCYDILIIDYRLQTFSGLDILIAAKERLKSYRAILLTAYSNRDLLEQGINNNLFFKIINKPFENTQIQAIVEQAAKELEETVYKEKRFLELKQQLNFLIEHAESIGHSNLVYIHTSTIMKKLLENVKEKYAPSNANTIIIGENGVGKEIFTHIIHKYSRRSEKVLVKINCAAIPESLFESEMFGHEKGAFTGASEAKTGKFQVADGGTIFLDEISELPLNLQAKLLRVIENQEVMSIGAKFAKHIDVRVISATNRDLETMVKEGKFREDLFYRISTIIIRIPPLRERKEDIPILAAHFLSLVAIEEGGVEKDLSHDALNLITQMEFNGNIRELKNLSGVST